MAVTTSARAGEATSATEARGQAAGVTHAPGADVPDAEGAPGKDVALTTVTEHAAQMLLVPDAERAARVLPVPDTEHAAQRLTAGAALAHK